MKNIFINLVIIFFFLSLISCGEDFFKKEVEPPHISTQPQCVVTSYLSPNDDEIKVDLRWSNPVFGVTKKDVYNKPITDAKVKISKASGESVQLFLSPNDGIYTADTQSFRIKENEKYHLEVEVPNKPKVTADCETPSLFSSEIENIQIVKTSKEGSPAYQITFEFNDIPNKKNYYLADIKLDGYYIDKKVKVEPFTDFNRDGSKILVRSESLSGNVENVNHVTINLFSVDKAFYDYKRTILQQENSEDLGPFAESVIVISNINNGLGVFGGYTKISREKSFN